MKLNNELKEILDRYCGECYLWTGEKNPIVAEIHLQVDFMSMMATLGVCAMHYNDMLDRHLRGLHIR